MTKTALTFLIFSLIFPATASAQEAITYKAAQSYKEKQVIAFIDQSAGDSYIIAPIDLNNDAINEYIVKPAISNKCSKSDLCPHHIIALQARKPIQIGQFDAHKILISNKKTYGIRQIIVYNVQHNDFQSQIAAWSPLDFMFTYN